MQSAAVRFPEEKDGAGEDFNRDGEIDGCVGEVDVFVFVRCRLQFGVRGGGLGEEEEDLAVDVEGGIGDAEEGEEGEGDGVGVLPVRVAGVGGVEGAVAVFDDAVDDAEEGDVDGVVYDGFEGGEGEEGGGDEGLVFVHEFVGEGADEGAG